MNNNDDNLKDIERMIEIIEDFNIIKNICKNRGGADEMFYIYLANFRFFMETGDYLEASNSLDDLLCYNLDNEKVRYHINKAIAPYKSIQR